MSLAATRPAEACPFSRFQRRQFACLSARDRGVQQSEVIVVVLAADFAAVSEERVVGARDEPLGLREIALRVEVEEAGAECERDRRTRPNRVTFIVFGRCASAFNTVRLGPKSIQNLSWPPHVGMDDDLTKDYFDKFLEMLHAQREEAEREYELLRRKLILYFEMRRSHDPEYLADITISTVVSKIEEGTVIHDVFRYTLGVARNVYRNYIKEEGRNLRRFVQTDPRRLPAPTPDEDLEQTVELHHRCLYVCLAELPTDKRQLFVKYYKEPKNSHKYRENLAGELGISLETLRVQILRIRRSLETCIRSCVKKMTP